MTATSSSRNEAVALSKSMSTLSGGMRIVQNKPFDAVPGL
jgi:hypothetical protein